MANDHVMTGYKVFALTLHLWLAFHKNKKKLLQVKLKLGWNGSLIIPFQILLDIIPFSILEGLCY